MNDKDEGSLGGRHRLRLRGLDSLLHPSLQGPDVVHGAPQQLGLNVIKKDGLIKTCHLLNTHRLRILSSGEEGEKIFFLKTPSAALELGHLMTKSLVLLPYTNCSSSAHSMHRYTATTTMLYTVGIAFHRFFFSSPRHPRSAPETSWRNSSSELL